MANVLSIHGISKRYGGIHALKGFSLEISPGKVYGILGPNGSGKSTTLGIVLGIVNADSGSYEWFGGSDASTARKRIGALLETPNFYPYMNAVENLRIVAKIKDVPESDLERVLKITGLWERRHSKFKGFSLGMKQRLAMAATLLGDPEVLVLDEPANGLDPQGIVEARELILNLRDAGKTILMASHIIDEVEKVCDEVVVLKSGELLGSGSVNEVLALEDRFVLRAKDMDKLNHALSEMPEVHIMGSDSNGTVITLADDTDVSVVNSMLHGKGVSLSELKQQRSSLENKFLEMVS